MANHAGHGGHHNAGERRNRRALRALTPLVFLSLAVTLLVSAPASQAVSDENAAVQQLVTGLEDLGKRLNGELPTQPDKLGDFGPLADAIPLTELDPGSASGLNPSALLRQIVDSARAHVPATGATFQSLEDALNRTHTISCGSGCTFDVTVSGVSVSEDPANAAVVEVALPLNATRNVNVPVSFAQDDLALDGGGIAISLGLAGSLTFRLDTSLLPASPDLAFSIVGQPTLKLSARANASIPRATGFTASFGFTDLTVWGSVALNLGLDIGLRDPDGNGRITAAEFKNSALTTLVNARLVDGKDADGTTEVDDVNAALRLDASIIPDPTAANPCGDTSTADLTADGCVLVSDANLGDNADETPATPLERTVHLNVIDRFKNITAAEAINGLAQLVGSLNGAQGFGDGRLPFVGDKLSKAFDFAKPVTDFVKKLVDAEVLCGTKQGARPEDPPSGSTQNLKSGTEVFCRATTQSGLDTSVVAWGLPAGVSANPVENTTDTDTVGGSPTKDAKFEMTADGTFDATVAFTIPADPPSVPEDQELTAIMRPRSAVELFTKLAEAGGFDPDIANLSFDPATSALKYRLQLTTPAPPKVSTKLDFGDLLQNDSKLAGLTDDTPDANPDCAPLATPACIAASGASMDMTFGVILVPDVADITPAVGNPQVTDRFFLQVQPDTHEIAVADLNANASLKLKGRVGFLEVTAEGNADANPAPSDPANPNVFEIRKADPAKPVLAVNVNAPGVPVGSGPSAFTVPNAIVLGDLLGRLADPANPALEAECNLAAAGGLAVSGTVSGREIGGGSVGFRWNKVFKQAAGNAANKCAPNLSGADGIQVTTDANFDGLTSFDPFPSVRGTVNGGPANATILTDLTKNFQTVGNLLDLTLKNVTTGASCSIGTITQTTLECRPGSPLSGGSSDKWNNGDEYEVEGNPLALLSVILDNLDQVVTALGASGVPIDKEIPGLGISTRDLAQKIQGIKATLNDLRGVPPATIACGTADGNPPTGDAASVPDGTTVYCQATPTSSSPITDVKWRLFRASVDEETREVTYNEVTAPAVANGEDLDTIGASPTKTASFVVNDDDGKDDPADPTGNDPTTLGEYAVRLTFTDGAGEHIVENPPFEPDSLQKLSTTITEALGIPEESLLFELADLAPGGTAPRATGTATEDGANLTDSAANLSGQTPPVLFGMELHNLTKKAHCTIVAVTQTTANCPLVVDDPGSATHGDVVEWSSGDSYSITGDGTKDLVVRLGYSLCTEGNTGDLACAGEREIPAIQTPLDIDLGAGVGSVVGLAADADIGLQLKARAQFDFGIPLAFSTITSPSISILDTSGLSLATQAEADDVSLTGTLGPLAIKLGTAAQGFGGPPPPDPIGKAALGASFSFKNNPDAARNNDTFGLVSFFTGLDPQFSGETQTCREEDGSITEVSGHLCVVLDSEVDPVGPLGQITLSCNVTTSGDVALSCTPGFPAVLQSLINGEPPDWLQLIKALPPIVENVRQKLDGAAQDVKLPVIGDALDAGADVADKLNQGVLIPFSGLVTNLETVADGAPNGNASGFVEATEVASVLEARVYGFIGPDADGGDPDVPDLLSDTNGDGTIDADDVTVSVTCKRADDTIGACTPPTTEEVPNDPDDPDAGTTTVVVNGDGVASIQDIRITALLGQGVLQASGVGCDTPADCVEGAELPFDLGLDGVPLRLQGTLQGDVSWRFLLDFGLDRENGPYMVVDNHGATAPAAAATVPSGALASGLDTGAEAQVAATIKLGDNLQACANTTSTAGLPATLTGFSGQGNSPSSNRCIKGLIGFLSVTARDGDTASDPAKSRTEVAVRAEADLTKDGASGSELVKLSFSDLVGGQAGIELGFSANANVNLMVRTGVAGASGPDFPSLLGRFHASWGFAAGTVSEPPLPSAIRFDELNVDAGRFVSQMVNPVTNKVKRVTSPLMPVIEVLEAELPGISDLAKLVGEPPITLISIIEAVSGQDLSMVRSVIQFVRFANAMPTLGPNDNLVIPIGGLAGAGGAFNLNPGLLKTPQTPDNAANLVAKDSFLSAGSNLLNRMDTASAAAFPTNERKQLNANAGAVVDNRPSTFGVAGLSFPIFSDASKVFGVLMGADEAIVQYDIGTLRAQAGLSYNFGPIMVGPVPISIVIGGSVSVEGQFGVGLSTKGLRQVLNGGNASQLLNGFFLADHRNGVDVPEVRFVGTITAGAALDLVIVSAGVEGGISLTTDMNLDDRPSNDGRLDFDEIVDRLDNPICLFVVSGQLDFFLQAFVKIDFFFYSKKFTFQIVRLTLLKFEVKCEPPPPNLADVETTGSGAALRRDRLVLNVGARAPNRHVQVSEPNEEVTVRQLTNASPGVDCPESYGAGAKCAKFSITGFGVYEEEYLQVGAGADPRVEGNPADGDDKITLEAGAEDNPANPTGPKILTPFTARGILNGGLGNDELVTGSGNDQVTGGPASITEDELDLDRIITGAGSDTIDGGADDDSIDAGFGNDGTLASPVRGGAGNDTVNGGPGTDVLDGGAGDDNLVGGPGLDPADPKANLPTSDPGFTEPDKADTLIGNGGDDTLAGNFGDDTLYGDGRFSSGITPLACTSDTSSSGDDGSDVLNGDQGSDTLYGGGEADQLKGDIGNRTQDQPGGDTLCGNGGNDELEGLAGNDTANGGSGDDNVVGGLGTDTVDGGAGRDYVLGDEGTLTRNASNQVAVSLGAGAGEPDTIAGGGGDDTLYGQGGGDTMHGDAGTGSPEGADTMYGGLGNDTMNGNGAADTMFGEGGTDTMKGNAAGDQMSGGPDADTMYGDDVTESASDGADTMFGDGGPDTMFGGGAGDTMRGGTEDDVMSGGTGADTMHGEAHDDRMYGNDGGDTMYGEDGQDIVIGGSQSAGAADDGTDTIHGGDGATVDCASLALSCAAGLADDQDVIAGDNADILPKAGSDTPAAGVVVKRRQITLHDVDGSVGDGDTLYGEAGFDRIFGQAGADTIGGGIGDDYVEGGDGGDTVSGDAGQDDLVGGGSASDGQVTDANGVENTGRIGTGLPDSGTDTIDGDRSSDAAADQASDVITGDNARIVRPTNAGQWILDTFSTDPAAGAANVVRRAVLLFDVGTVGSPAGAGTSDGDDLRGRGARDLLYGQGGGDALSGGAGDDSAYGGDGADTIRGDAGQDDLVGGTGRVDSTSESSAADGRLDAGDTIHGGDGAGGVASGDVDSILGDNGVLLRPTDGSGLWIPNTFNGAYTRTTILLDVGVAGGPAGAGTSGNDQLSGEASDDVLYGQGGNDRAGGGGGDDYVEGNANGSGNAPTSTFAGDVLTGDAGQDDLVGGTGRITRMDGGAPVTDPAAGVDGRLDGADQIDGNDASDAIAGDNAVLERPLDGAGAWIADDLRDPDALGVVRRIVRLLDVATVANGAPLANGTSGGDTIRGGEGYDRASGQGGGDSLEGNAGDDQLAGNAGADTISGGEGQDDLTGGTGRTDSAVGSSAENGRLDGGDTIHGNEGEDVVLADNGTIDRPPFGADYAPAGPWALDDLTGDLTGVVRRITVTLDVATVADPAPLANGTNGADTVTGDAGFDQLYGQGGDDDLRGNAGDDRIEGNEGDDTLRGDAGQDDLIGGTGRTRSNDDASAADGRIDDSDPVADGGDEIHGGDGAGGVPSGDFDTIAGDNATIDRSLGAITAENADRLPSNGAWEKTSWSDAMRRVVRLYDLSRAPAAEPDARTAGRDALNGEADDDLLFGQGGNDTITGAGGDDYAEGNGGDDRIVGNGGQDDVTGGGSANDGVLDGNRDGVLDPGRSGEDLRDGEDELTGDDGDAAAGDGDVLAGDNARVQRLLDGSGAWRQDAGRGTTLRAVRLFDLQKVGGAAGGPFHAPPDVSGVDTIDTNGGNDIAFGQGNGSAPDAFGNETGAGAANCQTMGLDGAGSGPVGAPTGDDDGDGLPDLNDPECRAAEAPGDLVLGQDGQDYLEGNQGSDRIDGGQGEDDITGGSSSNDGNVNAIVAPADRTGDQSPPADLLDGHDQLRGDVEDDTIAGDNAFVDRYVGPDGAWSAIAGPGRPADPAATTQHPERAAYGPYELVRRLVSMRQTPDPVGAFGDDLIYGSDGDDNLYGQLGNDWIEGEAGEDAVVSDLGRIVDNLLGAGADDVADPAALDQFIAPPQPFLDDTVNLTGVLKREVELYAFDTSQANAGIGHDVVLGGPGNDSIHTGPGEDLANGNAGDDRLFLGDSAAHVTVGSRRAPGRLAHEKVDAAWGGEGHDHLWGGYGADFLDVKPRTGETAPGLLPADDPATWFQVAGSPDPAGLAGLGSFEGFDTIYGGWGQDALQADEGGNGPVPGDRLLDWSGAFNVYYLCPATYGDWVSTRSKAPGLQEFLQQLAEGDGASATATAGSSGFREIGIVFAQESGQNANPHHSDTPGHFTCDILDASGAGTTSTESGPGKGKGKGSGPATTQMTETHTETTTTEPAPEEPAPGTETTTEPSATTTAPSDAP